MIIDAHSHLEVPLPGIIPDPERRRQPHGLIWSYGLMRFHNPLWRGEPPEPARIAIAAENQLRLGMGSRGGLLDFMDRNAIGKAVVLPIEPWSSTERYLDECERRDPVDTFRELPARRRLG